MTFPCFIGVGDCILLRGGCITTVRTIEGDWATLEDGSQKPLRVLTLNELTPAHLALYLFTTHGRDRVMCWEWDGGMTELLEDFSGFLDRYAPAETLLLIVQANHYSWQDEGRLGLKAVAMQVQLELRELIAATTPPQLETINTPLS